MLYEVITEMLALLPDDQREVVISYSVLVDDLTQAVVMFTKVKFFYIIKEVFEETGK